MSQKESGYRGNALKMLRDARVDVGDIISISRGNQVYEGILIPRSEYGDDKHVVVKLRNGYNIGIAIASDTTLEKIGKGTKPTFAQPSLPEQDPKLPKIVIISTGGTIASRVDYRTGGVRPALSAQDLYSVVPELAEIARIETRILLSLFSENIEAQHWKEIAEAAAREISEGADGIVVAHGTDTMGYTAAALSFALQNLPVPVVVVGSQRSADRPSSDAATNLLGAVLTAAKAQLAGVVVAMHENSSDKHIALHLGSKVRKCHTSGRDAFKSVNATPIAIVEDRNVRMLQGEYQKRDLSRKAELKSKFEEKVVLLKFYPGMDPAVIDFYISREYRGIVLEGTGLGHIGKRCHEAVKRAVERGMIVGMTSQCIWGRVNMNVYDSGRDLQALGVIPLEDILPETALVKLMWVLGQTRNIADAERLLKTNIAGEISSRTLPEKMSCEKWGVKSS